MGFRGTVGRLGAGFFWVGFYMSHSLNSLKEVIRDYIGDYYGGSSGGIRSLDYGSYRVERDSVLRAAVRLLSTFAV